MSAPVRTSRPIVGASILAVGVVIVGLTFALELTAPEPFEPDAAFQLLLVLAFVVLGAVTVWLRPENRTSWLMAWVGVMLGLSILTDEYGTPGGGVVRAVEDLQTVARWFSSWLWPAAFGPLATLLLLWFPTGRPPSPRWKPVEVAAFSLLTMLPLFLAFAQDPESEGVNPLAIPWMTAVLEAVFTVLSPLFPVLVAACAVSLVVRFRASSGDERQQLKWFVVAAFCIVTYMTVDTIVGSVGPRPAWLTVFEVIGFLSLPLAAGLAILKYRLYDIDLVVNRTLVYGVLTAILAGFYVGLVFGLQALLAPFTAESDLAIAGSTLAVAGLFRPVRARVQAFIDKSFYRRRFDAQRTLEDFSNHLRDEVDLRSLSSRLEQVVADTMQPAHVSLWLRGGA